MGSRASKRVGGSRKQVVADLPTAASTVIGAQLITRREELNALANELGAKVKVLTDRAERGEKVRGLRNARHQLRKAMDERDRISGQIAEIDRRLAAGTSVTGALDTPLDPNAPTPERLAKGDVYQGKHHIVDETEPTKVRENFTGYRSQAAIDHYLACGIIDETQWRAGDMLRADYFRAEMVRGVTASYAEPTGPGDGDAALEVVAARTSLAGAMSAVGPALSGVVVHVVCLGQTAKSWSEQNGRKGRQAETEGMALLKAGLFNLAVYYGLVAAPEPAIDRAARISSGPDVDAPTAKPASPLEPQFLMVPHAGRDGRKVLSVAKSAG